jgi:hypothetical protein
LGSIDFTFCGDSQRESTVPGAESSALFSPFVIEAS